MQLKILKELPKSQKKGNSRTILRFRTIEIYKALERKRFSDLYVQNGDAHDEQMAGIGNILESIDSSLVFNIADAIKEHGTNG